jgi:CheY-like chemotaxis protein
MEIIPFELDTVFETLSGLCAEKAQSRGLELLWHIAPEVPRNLIGDPLRLGQILIHYTRNALRFTQQGEVEVVVSVVAQQAASVKLRFDVRDTGVGLSEEQIDGLYSDFARLHNPTVRKHGSGGIGLAISRRLAGLMGGEVGVNSEPGAGATFWFTASLGLGTAQSRRVLDADLQHKRVLVVDDNANAAAVLCEQLLGLGCMAHGLVSGRAALHELRRAAQADAPYDVLMTDWQMPEMDGMDLVQRVHALQLPMPPLVVLVTAFGSDTAGPRAAQCGISHLLQKPVSPSMLLETMVDLFGVADSGADSTEPPVGAGALLDPVRGARILLVEDDEVNQQVTQETLESEGFVVALADNGQQALFRLDQSTREQRPYDLVLMDMQMPVLDGVSAVRLIRSMPQFQQLPIVAMTANAQEADRQQCMRSGMNDFVSKQIEPQTLWQALTQWIRPRAGLGHWAGAEGGGRAAAMQTLRRYLQQDDVRAVELFQQWRASLRQLLGEERFGHTEAALRAFNLEAALAMLREAGAFTST